MKHISLLLLSLILSACSKEVTLETPKNAKDLIAKHNLTGTAKKATIALARAYKENRNNTHVIYKIETISRIGECMDASMPPSVAREVRTVLESDFVRGIEGIEAVQRMMGQGRYSKYVFTANPCAQVKHDTPELWSTNSILDISENMQAPEDGEEEEEEDVEPEIIRNEILPNHCLNYDPPQIIAPFGRYQNFSTVSNQCMEGLKKYQIDTNDNSCARKCDLKVGTGLEANTCIWECYKACPRRMHIYFVNGMFTSFSDAASSARELSKQLCLRLSEQQFGQLESSYAETSGTSRTFERVDVLYNYDETFFEQLKQVIRQFQDDRDAKEFSYIEALAQYTHAPNWFRNFLSAYAKVRDVKMLDTDTDLQNMIQKYEYDFQRAVGVIQIAHSQGNFYANAASRIMYDRYMQSDVTPKDFSTQIATISVATPAALDPAGGKLQQSYVNLKGDVVTDWTSLRPATSTPIGGSSIHHYFLRDYLSNPDSKQQILEGIQQFMERMRKPADH